VNDELRVGADLDMEAIVITLIDAGVEVLLTVQGATDLAMRLIGSVMRVRRAQWGDGEECQ
jgi:hypothetical protein